MSVIIKLENREKFLTESLYIYNSLYQNRLHLARTFEEKIGNASPLRQKAIRQIINAIEHNSLLLQDVVGSIMEKLTLEDVVRWGYYEVAIRKEKNNLGSYLKDFRYLKRDWSGISEAEKEVEIIVSSLKKIVLSYLPGSETNKALFLGAGLCRIAWEHTPLFEKVYALDKSYSMVYHFHKLLNEDIDFYELNQTNILSVAASTTKHSASIKNSKTPKDLALKKLEYFVGDVMAIPLEDDSVSFVASVYFTDVLAIRLYLKEIKRVLKEGGIFLHFGPLAYFFSDIREHLTAEEIMLEFEGNGFEVLIDQTEETAFLPNSEGLMTTKQKNWVFAARYTKSKNTLPVHCHKTVLNIKSPVTYIEKGTVGEGPISYDLVNSQGKVFENGRSVIDIIEKFKGGLAWGAGVQELRARFELSEEECIQLDKTIAFLVSEGFLKGEK